MTKSYDGKDTQSLLNYVRGQIKIFTYEWEKAKNHILVEKLEEKRQNIALWKDIEKQIKAGESWDVIQKKIKEAKATK